jgi:hypothetical protein
MAKLLACAVCALALTLGVTVAAHTASAGPQPTDRILRDIREYRQTTWRLQSIMGMPRTRALAARRSIRVTRSLWWRHVRRLRTRYVQGPAHRAQWLCIHRYEGSWTDPAAPYYGGLQMDLSFQAAYGGYLLRTKGTADNWTPLEQMWVAERAYKSGRGFYPWPNTARYCGLI